MTPEDIDKFLGFVRSEIQNGLRGFSLSFFASIWEQMQSPQVHADSFLNLHPDPVIARRRAYVNELARLQGVTTWRSGPDR